MIANPKITVITCSYNQVRFLEKTIRSVLDQNYPNLEYIIIDGGSTDGSVEVIRKYSDRLAFWVSEKDNGQTDALIKGFGHATGDILCWLCSDDLQEPETLHEVNEFFQARPEALVVYGDSTWIDADDHVIGSKKEHAFSRFIWMYDHDFIPQPSTFWRRQLYAQVGGLNPAFNIAMDGDLWARFADVTTIHHVSRPWSKMRYHAEQKVQLNRANNMVEDRIIRQRYVGVRPEWFYRTLFIIARGYRVGWKLITGCYGR